MLSELEQVSPRPICTPSWRKLLLLSLFLGRDGRGGGGGGVEKGAVRVKFVGQRQETNDPGKHEPLPSRSWE